MRGDGRIYLRGQVYWVCYYLRGQQFRESADTSDPKQAGKFLKARLREIGADLLGARQFVTPKASRLTIAELVEALKADFQLRGKASPQNVSALKRVTNDLGTHRAVELTAERIDSYIQTRIVNGDAKASVNRSTQLLAQSYKLAVKRGYLTRVPSITHLSEAGNARQGFFSEQEFRAVLAHLPEDLKDFAHFAFITGMRKGEVASLSWSEVEGDVLTLRGVHSKNGDARTVPLVGELAEILKRRQAARQVEENGTVRIVKFIFHRDGAPVAEFRKSWATACVAAGLGKMVCPICQDEGAAHKCVKCKTETQYRGRLFHDFRRSAVRAMVQAGVPTQVAKKISGHKTDSMFQRYSILITDDLRSALEKTEQYRETAAKQKVVSMR